MYVHNNSWTLVKKTKHNITTSMITRFIITNHQRSSLEYTHIHQRGQTKDTEPPIFNIAKKWIYLPSDTPSNTITMLKKKSIYTVKISQSYIIVYRKSEHIQWLCETNGNKDMYMDQSGILSNKIKLGSWFVNPVYYSFCVLYISLIFVNWKGLKDLNEFPYSVIFSSWHRVIYSIY